MNKKNKQERKEILSKILDLKKLSPTVKNKKIIQKLQQQLENHE